LGLRPYQRDFSYRHDRGLYLSAALGPQWNHSIKEPSAKAIRFGGKLGLGWYVTDGVALFGAAWGNFLEQSTLVAVGPGVALLFDGPNIGLDISFGIGHAFNAFDDKGYREFLETVLATDISLTKYWWLSGKNCLGLSLNTGLHGFTLSKGRLGTFGWSAGLSLAFLFG